MNIRLRQVATARSGGKGHHVNIGVVALTDAAYEFLSKELTVDRVRAHFAGLGASHVERFELPSVGALNFVFHHVLEGGANRSPRIDRQGRLLGVAALEIQLPQPENLERLTQPVRSR